MTAVFFLLEAEVLAELFDLDSDLVGRAVDDLEGLRDRDCCFFVGLDDCCCCSC